MNPIKLSLAFLAITFTALAPARAEFLTFIFDDSDGGSGSTSKTLSSTFGEVTLQLQHEMPNESPHLVSDTNNGLYMVNSDDYANGVVNFSFYFDFDSGSISSLSLYSYQISVGGAGSFDLSFGDHDSAAGFTYSLGNHLFDNLPMNSGEYGYWDSFLSTGNTAYLRSITVEVVPEPGQTALLLSGLGLAGVAVARRRLRTA